MASNSAAQTATKQAQIQHASSTVLAGVAVASIIVSMALVILNILWGTASYNSEVHGVQEEARDALIANLEAVEKLEGSFAALENADPIIPDQPADKKNSEVILDSLPSRYDYPALVSSIDNLARRSAVNIVQIEGVDLGSEALQSSNAPFPEPIPVTVAVRGSYSALSTFLEDLDNSIRPMKVLDLTLTGSGDQLNLSIDLETYYQPGFDLTIRKKEVSAQ